MNSTLDPRSLQWPRALDTHDADLLDKSLTHLTVPLAACVS